MIDIRGLSNETIKTEVLRHSRCDMLIKEPCLIKGPEDGSRFCDISQEGNQTDTKAVQC